MLEPLARIHRIVNPPPETRQIYEGKLEPFGTQALARPSYQLCSITEDFSFCLYSSNFDAKQCRHHKDLPCHSSAALS
jgi:hypothetical protein